MIVQCEQCQTRFRIPDEKVTDKGVRVRCTRCQHTFRVARPVTAAAAGVQPSAAPPAVPALFDEPTRVGSFSSEELSRLGLGAPAAAPPRRPAPAEPGPLPGPAPSPVAEGLRRAASPMPPPAGAVALSTSQRPAPAPAPAPAARLDSAELFGGLDDVDLSGEPVAPRNPSLLGDLDTEDEAPGDSAERASTPSAADLENARALFDLPRREVIPPLPVAPPVVEPPPARALPLPVPAAGAAVAGPIAKPSGRPEDVGIPESRAAMRRTRQLLGFLVNVTVAAALALALVALGQAYAREGRLELAALAPTRLGELLLPAPRPLPLEDVSNGLYDTRDGRPVFFVRGEVVNGTQAPARVRLRATLYDGEQRVKGVEGLAGAVPSPEQLYALASAEDVAALRRRLDAGAQLLAPGERAGFTLLFFEYPPQLGDFRLELHPVAEAP